VREVPRVTIAVVPRETVTQVQASLETTVAHTHLPYRLVIVDACYPAKTRRWLDAFAREHDATLLRGDCALTPTESHNAALAVTDTEFVAFLDDNCFVREGWLDALLRCADETGAGVVGPLYGFRTSRRGRETVHVFAGHAHVETVEGRRVLDDGHTHTGEPLDEAAAELTRQPAETVELYCALVRRSVFRDIGPMDEGLLSLREHLDLCMRARDAGFQVWVEPAAQAIFELPIPIPWRDRPYFVFRWSRQQNEQTLAYFADKWDLDREATMTRAWPFVDQTRQLAYHFRTRPFDRAFRKVAGRALGALDRTVEAGVVAYQLRRRARSRGLRVAHAATWLDASAFVTSTSGRRGVTAGTG